MYIRTKIILPISDPGEERTAGEKGGEEREGNEQAGKEGEPGQGGQMGCVPS